MNLAEWCLKNNRTTFAIVALLILGGINAFNHLPKSENPAFTIRTALIVTRFPGASPQKVEELVTTKLEEKVQELGDVEYIRSQSLAGQSIIMVDLYEGTPRKQVRPNWIKLRNKIDEAAQQLPSGAKTPQVNDDFGDVFGMIVALSGDGFSYREMKDVAENIKDDLLRVPNVAKVQLFGTQEERIFVEFNNATLAERGVSPFLLAQVIEKQNIVQPSGNARVGPERVLLESSGEYQSVEDIGKTTLRLAGDEQAIALSDLATVKRGFVDPPTALTRINGDQSIVIAIHMAPSGSIIDVGQQVQAKVNDIQSQLPIGLDLKTVMWEPRFVQRKINDFMINLAEAFLFVFIVMLITTGLRTGLIASALIPMAILTCFNLMPVFNIAVQQISLASLIIALGILVDNGVVVSENILVRLTRGQDRLEAVKSTVRDLWKPLLAASLTTVWAFLPIAAAKSNVGEYCRSLFQVISLTLLASWIISLTLIPLLCYYFLKVKVKVQSYDGFFYTAYRNTLISALRHRWLFLAITLAITLAGGALFGAVKQVFFPPNEREILLAEVWLPYGSDINATVSEVVKFENFVASLEEVAQVTSFVGEGGPRWNLSFNPEQRNPNFALLLIETKGGKEGIPRVESVINRASEHLKTHHPDSRITLKKLENGPPVGAPIQVRLSGEKIDELYQLRDKLTAILAQTPGISDISDNWGEWAKKLEININQDKVKLAGLTSEDVALSLQTQVSGLTASDYREGDTIIPIVLRSTEAARSEIGKIDGMNVYSTSSTRNVPLLQVARPELVWQPSNIRRRNTARTLTVKAELLPGYFASDALRQIQPQVNTLMASDEWIEGYRVEYGGEQEGAAKAQQSIAAAFPLGVGLLLLTLITQFNSIRRPLIIGLTIPPMIFGIAVGLLITDAAFGFMAMLGMLSLVGIIVNNAIMLIDNIESLRQRGISISNAIVCSGLSRMRPILTTATTTVIGLVPLALQGGEFWRPMANTLIFGLSFATLLSLLLCPVLYSLFFKANFRTFTWNPLILKKTQD